MSITTDRKDPGLGWGVDEEPTHQNESYLVSGLKTEFIRPVRQTYVHKTCGTSTSMALAIAETYARDPKFYGSTYCVRCQMHRPVSEFNWEDGTEVGS